jgi:hypothetical protein
MSPETCAKLEQKLNEHGLTVMLTRDHTAIMLQLARLAQFERQLVTMAQVDRPLAAYVKKARELDTLDSETRVMETLDIPEILTAINRGLHGQITRRASIDPARIPAAVTAFIGIICRR